MKATIKFLGEQVEDVVVDSDQEIQQELEGSILTLYTVEDEKLAATVNINSIRSIVFED